MIVFPTSDVAALADTHREAFDAAWSAEEIATLLASPGVFALAAEGDVAPAGFILCRAAAGEAEILTLAVRPARRRRGVARALIAAAAVQLAQIGVETLFLEVAEDNVAALALYLGADFAEVGRRRDYYAGPVDALVLRRDLNSPPGGQYASADTRSA